MSFFKRHRVDSAVAGRLNLPGKTEIHNPAPNYASVALVVAFFVLSLPFCAWLSLVGLFDALGEFDPGQAAAKFLLAWLQYFLAGGLIVGGAFLFAHYFISLFFAHAEQMKQLDIQLAERQQRNVQALPAGTAHRMTSEQTRLYRAVMVAMDAGYKMIDDRTGKLTGKVEPWSRRSVGQIQLLNEQQSVGENTNLASTVKRYLLTRNILLDDRTVNVSQFPDINHVEAQLQADFGPLVQLGRSRPADWKETHSIINLG